MRIRTDGKYARREDTIEQAGEFWDCNKTKALLQSAEFAARMDRQIQAVLRRDDLTVSQKRDIAETLSLPGTYSVDVSETVETSLN